MTDKKFDFPKEKGLQNYSAVYVPSTQDVNKPISKKEHDRRANEVRNFMNKKFGGTTSIKAVGSYTDSKGKVVNENVIKVENFSDSKDYNAHDQEIEAFVEAKAREWGQESILYEFEAPKRPHKVVFVKQNHSRKNLKAIS